MTENEVVKIEELPLHQREVIREVIAESLSGRLSGNGSLLDTMIASSTGNAILNFRTIALSSYVNRQFDMPDALKPFVDRVQTLVPGGEVTYHNNRMGYLEDVFRLIDKNPRHLRTLEVALLAFYRQNVLFPNTRDFASVSNAWLQFRQMEAGVSDLYAMLSIRRFGEDRYISGIGRDGKLHTKTKKRLGLNDSTVYYSALHSHAVTFLSFDPESFQNLIPENAEWASDPNRMGVYKGVQAGQVGFRMLQAGQDAKHYHSSLPHHIRIRSGGIEKIIVRDNPPRDISLAIGYADGKISLGFMSSEYPDGGTIACLSDNPVDMILNNTQVNTYDILFDLAGAIARDMFICDEKTRRYNYNITEVLARSEKVRQSGRLNERAIWLPRFQVVVKGYKAGDPDLKEYMISLAPCHVSGHKRKCDNPSPEQIELAKSVGMPLPQGYTFVGEYDKGRSEEFRRVYRSKSAMSTLYGAQR